MARPFSPAPSATVGTGPSVPTVPASIARALLDSARLDPPVERRLLREAGFAAGLPTQAGARVPGPRLSQLWRLLAARLDDEMSGLFARPVRGGSTKLLCLSLIDSPNLVTALHRLRGFVHVAREDFAIGIHRGPRDARIAVLPNCGGNGHTPLGILMVLKLLHGLASWLIAQQIPLRQASFGFAADGLVADCAELFPGPARFGDAVTALSIAPTILDQPLRRSRRDLRGFLARTPHDWLFDPGEPPLAEQVRQFLAAHLADGSADVRGAAAALHLSTRTLTRRLRTESHGFQSIKDSVRRDIALERLATTRQPLSEIAEALGFEDTASFFRAFRRWAGCTPAAFRRRGGDGIDALRPLPPDERSTESGP